MDVQPIIFLSFIFAASSISQNTGSAAWLIPLLLFAIVVSFAAEKWLPYEKAWNTPQGDFGRDIVHAIVNEGSLALTCIHRSNPDIDSGIIRTPFPF